MEHLTILDLSITKNTALLYSLNVPSSLSYYLISLMLLYDNLNTDIQQFCRLKLKMIIQLQYIRLCVSMSFKIKKI